MSTFDEVADDQLVAGRVASIELQYLDQNEEAADPGVVTVTISRSDGTAVATSAATDGTGTDPRSYTFDLADLTVVDRLTAVWSDASANVIASTVIDVVGADLVPLADFRSDERLSGKLADADIRRARREVDDFVRWRCHRSFVRRLDVEVIESHGECDLVTRVPDVQSVRWATDEDGATIDVSSAVGRDVGAVRLDDGWPCGLITVGYVHGMNRPPRDVAGAVSLMIRGEINRGKSGTSPRTQQADTPYGTSSWVPIPGYGQALTGVAQIDEALNAARWKGARGIG